MRDAKRGALSGSGAAGRGNADPLADLYGQVLRHAGALEDDVGELDLERTPARVSRMLREELLSSYQPGALKRLRERFTTFPTKGSHEMVTVGPVPFTSLCAHHLLPFVGNAWVGYVPKARLVGLSKIPRTVEFFARKLQMQERMTTQIANFMMAELKPAGVIVFTEARHFCMEARGVRCPGALTRASALRGIAQKREVKSEFYALIGMPKNL